MNVTKGREMSIDKLFKTENAKKREKNYAFKEKKQRNELGFY